MKRITVDISEELHSEFKSVAAKQGIAISAVIRMLILQWLAKQEGARP